MGARQKAEVKKEFAAKRKAITKAEKRIKDLVKRVYVYAPQKIDGKRTQEIDIYYDLVGFLPLSLFQQEKQDSAA